MNRSPLEFVSALPDEELVGRLTYLARRERHATVELVTHLAELDARKLYLRLGYGSLFSYCTGALRLSEHAAYNRIEAARVCRRFPGILGRLADGSANLSTLRLLAPHLTTDNCDSVLHEASGRSKREVEVLVARLAPSPDVPAIVRKLPEHRVLLAGLVRTTSPEPPASGGVAIEHGLQVNCAGTSDPAVRPDLISAPRTQARTADGAGSVAPGDTAAPGAALGICAGTLGSCPAVHPLPAWRPEVCPLSPGRYRLQCTLDQETHDQLRLLQDLLRREIPNGDPGRIVARALKLLLQEVARKKLAATAPAVTKGAATWQATKKPVTVRPAGRGSAPACGGSTPIRSRHVPAHVRRGVWLRDGGQCAFVGWHGGRCRERAFLEIHHVEPYAIGGEATLGNLSLRCRAHNAYEARLVFGPAASQPRSVGAGGAGGTGRANPRQLAPGRVAESRTGESSE